MSNIYGEIIRKEREEKRMPEEECARICALSPEDYRKMEDGELSFGKAELVLMANALGLSSSALEKGKLVRKKELPDLGKLIEKLEIKIMELQSGIAKIRILIDETFSKVLREPDRQEEMSPDPSGTTVMEEEVTEEKTVEIITGAPAEENAEKTTESKSMDDLDEPERSEEVCLVK